MRSFVLAAAATILLSAQALTLPAGAQQPAEDKDKSTPSFNDDDLDRLAGRKPGEPRPTPAPVPAVAPPPREVGAGNGPSEEGENGPSGEGGAEGEGSASEAGWAERAAGLRGALAAAEDTLKGMEERAQSLLWEYLQSTDTEEILRLKAEQQGILDRIPEAKSAVEAARTALLDLEREAARAGVPRGELREKKKP